MVPSSWALGRSAQAAAPAETRGGLYAGKRQWAARSPTGRAAASFMAGCVTIRVLRQRAEAVTLVLGVVAYGLATALCSLAAGGDGVFVRHDPVHA